MPFFDDDFYMPRGGSGAVETRTPAELEAARQEELARQAATREEFAATGQPLDDAAIRLLGRKRVQLGDEWGSVAVGRAPAVLVDGLHCSPDLRWDREGLVALSGTGHIVRFPWA